MAAKKTRGGQPNNTNAVTHGRHSRATREARRKAWEAEQERSRAWAAACPQTDYAGIAEDLRRMRLAGMTGGQSRARH
jgi:hypothetical protein